MVGSAIISSEIEEVNVTEKLKFPQRDCMQILALSLVYAFDHGSEVQGTHSDHFRLGALWRCIWNENWNSSVEKSQDEDEREEERLQQAFHNQEIAYPVDWNRGEEEVDFWQKREAVAASSRPHRIALDFQMNYSHGKVAESIGLWCGSRTADTHLIIPETTTNIIGASWLSSLEF